MQENWSAVIPKCKRTFLEKYTIFLGFSDFTNFLLKYENTFFRKKYEFFKLGARKFHFQIYKKFFGFFYLLSLESSLPKFSNLGARKLNFLKHKKSCF